MKKNLTNSTPSKLNLGIIACLVMFLGFIMSSCLRDKDEYRYIIGPDDFDGTETIFTMNVATPALSKADWGGENTLNTLDVLAFDSITGEYRYRTYGTDLDPTGNNTTARVKLKLTESGEKHQFVLLGNLRKEINKLSEQGEFDWDPLTDPPIYKEDLLKKITFEVSDDPWNITTPRYLPMWGETRLAYEIDSVGNLNEPIKEVIQILRSVAKVDIYLKPEAGREGYFQLEQIIVANVPNVAHAIPDSGNVAFNSSNKLVAEKPTLIPGHQLKEVLYRQSLTWEKDSLLNTIYIPEQTKDTAHEKRLCLLIAGTYDKDGSGDFTGPDKKTTWYRVDFYDSEGYWLDILRNHHYSFYITSIDGDGQSTKDNALRSKSVNMKTETLVWDEFAVEEVYYDGYYYYYAGPREVTLGAAEVNDMNITKIVTNSRYTNFEIEVVEMVDNKNYGYIFKSAPELKDITTVTSSDGETVTTAYLYISLHEFLGSNYPDFDEQKNDIYIHFKDDDGFTKVSIPIRVTQTNDIPKYRVYTPTFELDPLFDNSSIHDRYAYILLEGNYENAFIQTRVELTLSGDHSSRNVQGTVVNGYNQYALDGLDITSQYDDYGSTRIKVPHIGVEGFVYKKDDSDNNAWYPYSVGLFRYVFEYRLKDSDNWTRIGYINRDLFYISINTITTSIDMISGGDWEIEITGLWEKDVILAVIDEQNPGVPIKTKTVSNPGKSTIIETIEIQGHHTPRTLHLYYSVTGSLADLDPCSNWGNNSSWNYVPLIQE